MPRVAGHAVARQRADELVERVVASDVFAHGDEPAAGLPECRGMDRARLPVELLARRQRLERAHDLGRRKGIALAHARRRPHRLVETFDAAEAAAGRAGEMPPPLVQGGGARFGQPHAQFDAGGMLDDIELADVRRRSGEALGDG